MRTDLIASLLVHARRSRQPLVVPDKAAVKTDIVAYRVQDKVYAKLWPGTLPAAWKVGAPSPKVEPAAAPIPPELVLANPARASAAQLNLIGVEAEVAYRLARDLPPRAKPYADEEIADAIGEVVVAIELCATRLAKWKEAPGGWKLADFQNSGALVAGSGTRNWRAINWPKQQVKLRVGERTSKATGAHPFGDPFRLVPWLAAHCAGRTGGLRKGDLVTTGAWTGLEPAKPGDEVVAKFPGIGEARVALEP
jgi:2-keto-4-pentenoate hydratase